MKKTDSRWTDSRITKGSSNIFLDLGFDEDEAAILKMRAEVMIRIEKRIAAKGWTQAVAARELGISQPRVSKIKRGEWKDFSLDMLLTIASRLGLRPKLKLAA
ncbi:MAG TPA: XRE family transcriptional regulator [Terriglobales bacterium]|nr:XRE family transcriptional regulator [Terriglobales bacterium]